MDNPTESREAYILKQEKKVKSKSSINTVKFPIMTVLKGTCIFFSFSRIHTILSTFILLENDRRHALGARVRIQKVLTGTSKA